jgi:hypothetical protein
MVRWALAHRAGKALAGALPVVTWQSRCCGALGTGTLCERCAGRRTPCGSLAAAPDETSAAAEVTVLWYLQHGHTVRERRWQAHSRWFPGNCC